MVACCSRSGSAWGMVKVQFGGEVAEGRREFGVGWEWWWFEACCMDVLPDFREGDVGVNAHDGGGVTNKWGEGACSIGPPFFSFWVGLVGCVC